MATEQHIGSTGVVLLGSAGNTTLVASSTLTIGGDPTGGTYTLQMGNQVTAPIAYNATNSAIQTAIQAISNGAGATVTGTGPFTIQPLTPLYAIGANGAALTGGTNPSAAITGGVQPLISTVQDWAFDLAYDAKEVSTAAVQSLFGIDVAYVGGKATAKLTVLDFNRSLITTLTNAIKTTVGSIDNFTIGATTTPIMFRLEFYGVDTNGKFFYWIATRAYSAKPFTDAWKIAGIAERTIDVDFLADPNATGASGYGIVGTMYQEQ